MLVNDGYGRVWVLSGCPVSEGVGRRHTGGRIIGYLGSLGQGGDRGTDRAVRAVDVGRGQGCFRHFGVLAGNPLASRGGVGRSVIRSHQRVSCVETPCTLADAGHCTAGPWWERGQSLPYGEGSRASHYFSAFDSSSSCCFPFCFWSFMRFSSRVASLLRMFSGHGLWPCHCF